MLRARPFTILFAAMVCLTFPTSLSAQSQDMEKILSSHYVGKPIVLKLPMPVEGQPMLLYPGRDKIIDQGLYEFKLEKAGVGLDTGMVAVIKSFEVNNAEIDVHLVGVGYELPPGRIPAAALDAEVLGQGSARIRVKASERISGLQNPVTTINSWLSTLFDTRALVSAEGLPLPVVDAINRGEVLTGMNRRAVYLSFGDPTEIIRELKEESTILEVWIYELEDFTTRAVIFKNGRVEKQLNY